MGESLWNYFFPREQRAPLSDPYYGIQGPDGVSRYVPLSQTPPPPPDVRLQAAPQMPSMGDRLSLFGQGVLSNLANIPDKPPPQPIQPAPNPLQGPFPEDEPANLPPLGPAPLPTPPIPPDQPPQVAQDAPQQTQTHPGALTPGEQSRVVQAFNPQDPYAAHFSLMNGFEGTGVNPESGAAGFGQVLPRTYADWVTRYRHRYPWMPATFEEWKKAPLELQQRVYREIVYPNEYQPALQNAGLEFSPINAAVTNFLGPTGGPAFLRGAMQNPQAPSTSLASPEAVAANRNVFFDRETGRERTAAEVVAYIGRGQGGALTGVNTAQGDVTDNTNAATSIADRAQANPYRDRLFQLLQQIESERGQRPDLGEFMFRMGSGILSGRNFMEGLGRGGQVAAEYLQQHRAAEAQRDSTLMSGYRALASDRSLQQYRDIYNAPRNIRIMPRDGSRPFDVIGRVVNGQALVLDPRTGQEVPVQQAYPGANVRFAGVNEGLMMENQAGGIRGAVDYTEIGGERIPIFKFDREGQEKNYGYGLNAIMAHQGLEGLERSGYDPTRVQAAIAQAIADKSPMSIQQFLRQFTDPRDQQYAAYALQYINAIARRESGAQINEGEWARYASIFVPRIGADPSTVEEHNRIRYRNLIPLIGSAGPAAAYLADIAERRRNLPSAYSDPRVVEEQFVRPRSTPSETGGVRRLERLTPSTINALGDDEEVQVKSGNEWITVTGRQLKEELRRRQGN